MMNGIEQSKSASGEVRRDSRILARKLARELTLEELESVNGGSCSGVHVWRV